MGQRLATALLLGLLLVLQAQLWFGRGSVPQVQQLREELTALQAANQAAEARNRQLGSEWRDLQEGLDMVEELARMELGMVKPNELFVQITDAPASARP